MNWSEYVLFYVYFQDEWSQNLRSRLETFLKSALRALPKPRLIDIYVSFSAYQLIIYRKIYYLWVLQVLIICLIKLSTKFLMLN